MRVTPGNTLNAELLLCAGEGPHLVSTKLAVDAGGRCPTHGTRIDRLIAVTHAPTISAYLLGGWAAVNAGLRPLPARGSDTNLDLRIALMVIGLLPERYRDGMATGLPGGRGGGYFFAWGSGWAHELYPPADWPLIDLEDLAEQAYKMLG